MSVDRPILKPRKKRALRKTQFQLAMATIRRHLRRYPDARRTWEANIAMCIYDETRDAYQKHKAKPLGVRKLHQVFNDGAKRFLDLLLA